MAAIRKLTQTYDAHVKQPIEESGFMQHFSLLSQGEIQDLMIIPDPGAAYEHCEKYTPDCDVPLPDMVPHFIAGQGGMMTGGGFSSSSSSSSAAGGRGGSKTLNASLTVSCCHFEIS